MKYDSRMGIAYDTIFFGNFYFNTDIIKQHFIKNFGAKENDFEFFYDLKSSISPPPPTLYPFYYCDLMKPSFLVDCLTEDFLFGFEDFLSFNERLQANPQSFVKALFQYYLGAAGDDYSHKVQFVQKILALELDHELLFQLINLWSNSGSVLQDLNVFIEDSYNAVKKLHEQEIGFIHNLLKTFKSNQFLKNLTTLSTINYSKSSRSDRVSVSLLNMILTYQISLPQKGNIFIFGHRCNECIDFHNNYSKMSVRTLCRAFYDPIKADILSCLNEGEYTVTQLSEKIFQSRQTVNRHTLWLLDYMFITVAKRKGVEVYYKINLQFFSVVKDILLQYFDKFLKGANDNTLEIKQEEKVNEKLEKTSDS